MKAVSPVRPSGRKAPSGCGGGGGGELALRCLAEHGHSLGGSAAAAAAAAAARCKAAEAAADEPALCLQCDMNDCYSRLRRLVPTIPPNKKVSKVELLQHVIDYILDLQLALETHPALLRQPPPPAPPHLPAGTCPAAPPRTPLTALNTDPVRGPGGDGRVEARGRSLSPGQGRRRVTVRPAAPPGGWVQQAWGPAGWARGAGTRGWAPPGLSSPLGAPWGRGVSPWGCRLGWGHASAGQPGFREPMRKTGRSAVGAPANLSLGVGCCSRPAR
ncbi:hypothetical protein K5549_004007 [Capra hircus]|uniref:DNA-binding protein inhibitor ID-4 n=1 Tax=Capra hircus TaxID=9925 RepID=A0A452FCH4_CAPHI|nr:hypothetical protein K5549_004007 [Capra hircus]